MPRKKTRQHGALIGLVDAALKKNPDLTAQEFANQVGITKTHAGGVIRNHKKRLTGAPSTRKKGAPFTIGERSALSRLMGPGVTKAKPAAVEAFRKAAAEIGIGEALALLQSDAAVLDFYKASGT